MKAKSLEFKKAFKFPFNRAKGMWNVLWVLLPIFGWLALGGYGVRIARGFLNGKFDKLPVMEFKSDMKLGWYMFIRALPFLIVFGLISEGLDEYNETAGVVFEVLTGVFVVPVLYLNFIKEATVASFFDFGKLGMVWNNFGDYIVAMLKSIGLGLIYVLMMVVLVGIPAAAFTDNIFIADFYRRHSK